MAGFVNDWLDLSLGIFRGDIAQIDRNDPNNASYIHPIIGASDLLRAG